MLRSVKGQQQYLPVVCGLVIAAFLMVLLIPHSRGVFRELSAGYPMIMGFIKFALLATIGELFAMRLTEKHWRLPNAIAARMLIWGFIGAVLAVMLKLYTGGAAFLLAEGMLPGEGSVFVKAAVTSILMNITFGPVMMAFHKMTDKYLELHTPGSDRITVGEIAEAVDWRSFYTFVVLKTIPLFWFPAHTITFMLPAEYQTIMAACLSMALGVILSLRKG